VDQSELSEDIVQSLTADTRQWTFGFHKKVRNLLTGTAIIIFFSRITLLYGTNSVLSITRITHTI
jgi:hypothetical protein